ncbi:MAG: type II secretion system protein [Thioclava sp.]|nr:type II secretion system protein [Thioclava sp.]
MLMTRIEDFALRMGIAPETLLAAGIGFGLLLLIVGLQAAFQRDRAAERIAAIGGPKTGGRAEHGYLKAPEARPGQILKAFVPADRQTRSKLERKLAQAGLSGASALRRFTLVRIALGIGLPGIFMGLLFAARSPEIGLPMGLDARLGSLSGMATYQILTGLVAGGYLLPLMWLNGRMRERRLRIEESFPNALDLMQVAIESGMGFDAAMTRVGNELAETSPEISFEFLSVQRQVQAGREREAALRDMADRTGVETVRAFANVASQSLRFGASMAQALTTYAADLRGIREMRAQEKANRLPVQMSGVLASLMLPALILIAVGPVVIRYFVNYAQ